MGGVQGVERIRSGILVAGEGSDYGLSDAAFFNDLNQNNAAATDRTWRGGSSSTSYLALTANLSSAVDQITSVAFYQEGVSANNLLGTAVNGGNGWTLYLPLTAAATSQSDYAVATDSMGRQVAEAELSPDPISLAQVTASNDGLYVAGDTSHPLTLTATGLLDSYSGTQNPSVSFYQDPSGTGVYNANSVGPKISTSYNESAGSWTTATINTTGWSGPQTFFAIASDGTLQSQPIAITIYPDQAPMIASLTAATDPSNPTMLELTANGVTSLTGAVTGVSFYQVGSGSPFATVDGAAGWSCDVPSDLLSGTGSQDFYAVATDAMGQTAPQAATTVNRITIGGLTAASGSLSGVYVPGDTLTLDATAILDWLSGTRNPTVTFYQDTSGSGVFNPATAVALNGSPVAVSEGSASVGVSTAGWSGTQTLFAVASDGSGVRAHPSLLRFPRSGADDRQPLRVGAGRDSDDTGRRPRARGADVVDSPDYGYGIMGSAVYTAARRFRRTPSIMAAT